MNTTPLMDKQIMDLTQGSYSSKDFIDLMSHPKGEEGVDTEDEARRGSHHQIGGNGIKEDIVPSYDFQPIRPLGASTQSPNHDSNPNMGGISRSWNSDSKANFSTPSLRDYNSLDSLEPAKVTPRKSSNDLQHRNAFDAAILSEIDQTMKKHMENLLHVMEGISARLTQLESRTNHLENSMDELKVSVGNNHGSTDGKMRQLENILREVQMGVQVLKDKQDVVEAQLQLTKLQVSKVDQQSETQTSVITDPAPQTASAPQQLQQQLPSPVNLPQSVAAVPHPNAPPHPLSQQGLPPPVQLPNQFPHNPIPSVPQREPYFQPPPQSLGTPNQQYQLPLSQQPHPPPVAPPQPQYQQNPQPQYPQPAPHPPQQQPSPSPVNPPPQLPSSMGHHVEDTPYIPPQNYPSNVRQPPPSGPPPAQQFYGPSSHVFEPLSSRSGSGFSSGYSAPSLPTEAYHYGGSPQYGGTSGLKPQLPPSAVAPPSGGSGYPQLPTARVLPHALPTASGASSSSGSGGSGSGSGVPLDDVVDKVASMGFPRDHVRATVRKLTENGQAVDLNAVLDKLMNESDIQPAAWYGR